MTTHLTTPKASQVGHFYTGSEPSVETQQTQDLPSFAVGDTFAIASPWQARAKTAVGGMSMDYDDLTGTLSNQIALAQAGALAPSHEQTMADLHSLRARMEGDTTIVTYDIPDVPTFAEVTALSEQLLKDPQQRRTTLDQIATLYETRRHELLALADLARADLASPNLQDVRIAREGLAQLEAALATLERQVRLLSEYRRQSLPA